MCGTWLENEQVFIQQLLLISLMLNNVYRRLLLILTYILRRLFDVYRLSRTEIYILFEWNPAFVT